MKKQTRNYIIILLFTIIVLYFSLKDNFRLVITEVFSIKIPYLILILFIINIHYIIKGLIIYLCSLNYNKKLSLKKFIDISYKTVFFNGVTPFSTGGQPFQILALKKAGLRIGEASSVVVFDTFVFQLSEGIFCIFALILNKVYDVIPLNNLIVKLIILVFILKIIICLFTSLILFSKKINRLISKFLIKLLTKILKNKEELINKVRISLNNYYDSSKEILKNKKTFVLVVLISILSFIPYYLIPYFIMLGLNIKIFSIIDCLVMLSFINNVASLIPIPGGTLGFESFFILIFSYKTNYNMTSIMLIWRFITYYYGLIKGAIILNIKKES